MSSLADPCAATVKFRPGPAAARLAVVVAAAGWLAALGGLIGTLRLLPDIGWPAALFPLLLCGSPPSAVWAGGRARALRRICAAAPDALLYRRHHGDLSVLAGTAPRPLRSVGPGVDQALRHTDRLLAGLIPAPNLRIFRGIRPAGTNLPLVSHAVSAGRALVLVETVAWPPGRYQTDADGRIRCDERYTGQSTGPLLTALRTLRDLLPRGHRITGLVVVRPTGEGRYILPAPRHGLTWALAEEARTRLSSQLGRDRVTVSRHILAALDTAPEPRSVTS